MMRWSINTLLVRNNPEFIEVAKIIRNISGTMFTSYSTFIFFTPSGRQLGGIT
jgi:hypothetical protein